jgi:hypothetical protein
VNVGDRVARDLEKPREQRRLTPEQSQLLDSATQRLLHDFLRGMLIVVDAHEREPVQAIEIPMEKLVEGLGITGQHPFDKRLVVV